MISMVAYLSVKMTVAQRLMNTKTAQKSIGVNVRFRIKVIIKQGCFDQ